MRIKNTSGQYWNADNSCFGPIQAATEYDSIYDMPDSIELLADPYDESSGYEITGHVQNDDTMAYWDDEDDDAGTEAMSE